MEKLQYLGNKMKIYVSEIHRYGTDAVLLADFSMPKNSDKACDFGTGCGIIPLVWRLNGSNCDIIAVDISADACAPIPAKASNTRKGRCFLQSIILLSFHNFIFGRKKAFFRPTTLHPSRKKATRPALRQGFTERVGGTDR